jgi:hypothetical protein
MTQAATAGTTGLSISRLRTLILVALVIGISIYTAVMFSLVQKLADRFGPQVRADLEWRALRGSQELAKTADLGLVMSDGAMVKESFGAYAQSSDVAAIIARDASDALVAQHGTFEGADALFKQPAGKLLTGPGYLASWTAAEIEGSPVGKIAVIVSTRRLTDAEALLGNVERQRWTPASSAWSSASWSSCSSPARYRSATPSSTTMPTTSRGRSTSGPVSSTSATAACGWFSTTWRRASSPSTPMA